MILRLLLLGLMVMGLAVGVWMGAPTIADFVWATQRDERDQITPNNRTLVYRLQDGRTTRFVFSQPSTIARVLSTPAIDKAVWDDGQHWSYGFRATLRDSADNVVAAHDIFSRSANPANLDEPLNIVRFTRGDASGIGTQDQSVIASDTPFVTMDIVPLPSNDDVNAIYIRAYERRPFLGRAAALAAYRRRSDDERQVLTRVNAFPERFISDDERQNSVINQWRPLGPSGISGRDYDVLVMYQGKRDKAAKGDGTKHGENGKDG